MPSRKTHRAVRTVRFALSSTYARRCDTVTICRDASFRVRWSLPASRKFWTVSNLRTRLSEALKDALRAKDETRVSTVRLLLAGIKDRDIAARPSGNATGISDQEILNFCQSAIKQRQDSIAMFEQGNRKDLADKENAEIAVIKTFLPQQFGDAEIADLAEQEIAATGAAGMKDMGKVMTALRAKYAGQMDFGKASNVVKGLLG